MGTGTENKEQLRKKFEEFLESEHISCERCISVDDWEQREDMVLDFFYAEILVQKNANTILNGALQFRRQDAAERDAKLSKVEELLRLADIVIRNADYKDTVKYQEQLNAYNTLKNKP